MSISDSNEFLSLQFNMIFTEYFSYFRNVLFVFMMNFRILDITYLILNVDTITNFY